MDDAGKEIYVHLWHPCYGIDVVRDVQDVQERYHLKNQGYIPLAEVRARTHPHQTIRERLEELQDKLHELEQNLDSDNAD